ncbi:Ferrous-iron efflux pump FieF [Legionella massiliensis]|uniref:Ferrous-iron efflux pump FieF n=1 Tax=Legionella massiliensis TaxID=1034943 RepID=A0A078KXC2_9GAMM|nr:cation diffusion facilitator family transporter [Legionella massiliensis]CDZ77707.1 Ferrous-iron efflux pump FieF [Legionella massiliensis]CEE13445.1 Ferrous-iron efflux pump FieF [Legionella massiliensis]
MNQPERYQQAKRITVIGALINALLGCIKVLGGAFFHSHALIADGVHSFSDLITDFMVVFASKYGSQDADDSHPYGHQRIETAATLLLAVLLIVAGAGIAWDSLDELLSGAVSKPGGLALIIAFLSILANEALFHYTHHVGQRIQSPLIIANAWHHRSDAAASLVVALGLLGALFGFVYLDAIAAVIVGCMIIKMGMSYGWNSVKELVDTAVEPEMLKQIEAIIEAVDGVQKIHQLRSRLMGGEVLIDVHILVSPLISVSEGHYIAQHVHRALINKLSAVKDVTVHVDPEDDEVSCPSLHLPNRDALEKNLILSWQNDFPELSDWTIHYLDGKLTIDLQFNPKFNDWQQFKERLNIDLQPNDKICQVRLFSNQGVNNYEEN